LDCLQEFLPLAWRKRKNREYKWAYREVPSYSLAFVFSSVYSRFSQYTLQQDSTDFRKIHTCLNIEIDDKRQL